MSNLLYNEGKTQEYILVTKHAVHPTVPAGYMSIRQRCFLCKARTFIVRLNATARLVKYAHSVRIASTNSNTIARMWMWMWVSVWMRAWMQIHAQLQVHLLNCRIESTRAESLPPHESCQSHSNWLPQRGDLLWNLNRNLIRCRFRILNLYSNS